MLALLSVNQRLPSGPPVIPIGTPVVVRSGYSVTVAVGGAAVAVALAGGGAMVAVAVALALAVTLLTVSQAVRSRASAATTDMSEPFGTGMSAAVL